MNFNEVKTPTELMRFLDSNIDYGVIDREGNRLFDSSKKEFQDACIDAWKVRPVLKIIEDGIGHCYDQVEIERFWFEKFGFIIKTFWISAYQSEVENSGFAHTYLVYQEGDKWKLFEHADYKNKGIHQFDSIEEAINWQKNKQIEFATSCVKPLKVFDVVIYEYQKPKIDLNNQQFLEFIEKQKQIIV